MPTRLAQHLSSAGLLRPDEAQAALRRAQAEGAALDTVLLERGDLPEATVLNALAEVSGVRGVDLSGFEPNREVSTLIPAKTAERLGAVPLSIDGDAIHVASGYPLRKDELDEVGFLLGKGVVFWVATTVRIHEWMASLYHLPLGDRDRRLLERLEVGLGPVEQPAAPPAPAPPSATAPATPALAEGRTLEESLTHDMVGSLPAQAREVEPVEEIIPLQVKKVRRPEPAPEPAPPVLYAALRPAAPGKSNPDLEDTQPFGMPSPMQEEAVVEWTLEDARAALGRSSHDRDALMEVVLRYARRAFEFTATLAVTSGTAVGWDARGVGINPAQIAQVSIPLDAGSVFRTVAGTRESYVGTVPADALSKEFIGKLGRSPRFIFLFPVVVKSRVVAILYGDNGSKPFSQRRLSDFVLFCGGLSSAFGALILSRKQGLLEKPPPLGAEPPRPQSLGWSPGEKRAPGTPGRAVSLGAITQSEGERPPPDFAPLLRKLTGPDAALRARAMAELARSPEASARVLSQNFPGPTAWFRMQVTALPEADELGPIPGALSRLGRPAAQALAGLLESPDPDTRYFALLTAGSLPFPELVTGLLTGMFDLEPDISSAARAASTAFRELPRFEAALKGLRQELSATDPLRRSLAARALGALHDRDAIEGLMAMTGSGDGLCAQAAAEALQDITLASFGPDLKAWDTWWSENRGRRRSAWLLSALRNPELGQRMAAIEELARVTGDPYGYSADAPEHQREAATRRWEQLIAQDARLRQVD